MSNHTNISFVYDLFTSIFFSFFILASAHAGEWSEIEKGLEYRDLYAQSLTPWAHVHVFRIDLNKYELRLIRAQELGEPYASAATFAKHCHALMALNGGFFDEKYHSLGLRISQYKEKSPIKSISWWGVFYIKNQKAYLTKPSAFKKSPQIAFAIQSGPRLLIDGEIPSLRQGRAQRSALGITNEGKLIILVTENAPLTTAELAMLLKAAPLSCENALNLDGGGSSQLATLLPKLSLNIQGYTGVSDAIIVKAGESLDETC